MTGRRTGVDLIVIHGISLPPGEFGGPWIDALFANTLDPAAHPYFQTLAGLRVSAHLLIRRDGEVGAVCALSPAGLARRRVDLRRSLPL
jgi:N-acetyl-anhydromuramyl-L-alanine amidase AmpD